MTVVIIHPPDCDCGRHVSCTRCFDSGYTSISWDANGRHTTACHCKAALAAVPEERP